MFDSKYHINSIQAFLSHCRCVFADNCGDMCLDYEEDYLSLSPGGIGRSLVFLAIQGFVYFVILFLIESRALQITYHVLFYRNDKTKKVDMPRSDSATIVHEDCDVARERHRIASSAVVREESLVLQELTKYYGTMLAVDRISVGIPQGECFGLLGINGAGKTTTFKMLTGDLTMTSGKAHLNGYDITSQMKEVCFLVINKYLRHYQCIHNQCSFHVQDCT